MGPLQKLCSSRSSPLGEWTVKNQVSCRPTAVLTIILCLFGFEQIRRSFLSGQDDDYLAGSFLEKFAL